MISISNLTYAWGSNPPVLDIPSFACQKGTKIFLQGESGSGKSTLLNLVCGVFEAQSGSIEVLGKSYKSMSPSARDKFRADQLGVIFQQFNLVPFLSLIENVLLPCRFSPARASRVGNTEKDRIDRAHDLLNRLGLDEEARSGRQVTALSVGQQQRVAAARALIGGPSLIIADEPTSALDHGTRNLFIETLLKEARQATLLFVSHDPTLAPQFDEQVSMADINKCLTRQPGEAA